jgi:hypothetical protein
MGGTPPAPTKKVFFHVGAPKTGTTYLQQVLFRNREALAANGVLYPYEQFADSFRSMLDFRDVGFGRHRRGAYAGEWAAVARRIREFDGPTVVVSNELLGAATPERIAAGVESVQPADVHVLFSARDFARQLVSDWQEHIKHKHTVTLEQFVGDLVELGLDAPKPFGELFWGLHDASYVLERWASVVPVSNIHVITVPQPGAPRDTLWRRFCSVTGIDPEAYPTRTRRSNPSMGVVETELVRRMNVDLGALQGSDYDRLVRVLLAERILGRQSAPLTLPAKHLAWVEQRSAQLVKELRESGYDVVGDLDELIPDAATHADFVSPGDLTDADLAPAAIRASTGLLLHAGRQRRRIQELEAQLEGRTETSRVRQRVEELYLRARARAGEALQRAGVRNR